MYITYNNLRRKSKLLEQNVRQQTSYVSYNNAALTEVCNAWTLDVKKLSIMDLSFFLYLLYYKCFLEVSISGEEDSSFVWKWMQNILDNVNYRRMGNTG